MSDSITYSSDEGILRRLYWPFTFLFSGVVLTWLTAHQASTAVFMVVRPMWVLAPLALIAIGIWAILSAIASYFLKLPRLTLTNKGIKLERFLSTWYIAWDELDPFQLPMGSYVQAKIIKGKYKGKGMLLIPPLNVDKKELLDQLGEWQSRVITKKSSG